MSALVLVRHLMADMYGRYYSDVPWVARRDPILTWHQGSGTPSSRTSLPHAGHGVSGLSEVRLCPYVLYTRLHKKGPNPREPRYQHLSRGLAVAQTVDTVPIEHSGRHAHGRKPTQSGSSAVRSTSKESPRIMGRGRKPARTDVKPSLRVSAF